MQKACAPRTEGYPGKQFWCMLIRRAPLWLFTSATRFFVSLEDEHGSTQVIVWKHVREAQRQVLLGARLLAVKGRWQREGEVCNLIAHRLADLSPMLGRLATESRDFK